MKRKIKFECKMNFMMKFQCEEVSSWCHWYTATTRKTNAFSHFDFCKRMQLFLASEMKSMSNFVVFAILLQDESAIVRSGMYWKRHKSTGFLKHMWFYKHCSTLNRIHKIIDWNSTEIRCNFAWMKLKLEQLGVPKKTLQKLETLPFSLHLRRFMFGNIAIQFAYAKSHSVLSYFSLGFFRSFQPNFD